MHRCGELNEIASQKSAIAQDLASKTTGMRERFKDLKWMTLKAMSVNLSAVSSLQLIAFCVLCVMYDIPMLITIVRPPQQTINEARVRTHTILPNKITEWRRMIYYTSDGRVFIQDNDLKYDAVDIEGFLPLGKKKSGKGNVSDPPTAPLEWLGTN